jgi:alpha-maltose-1-phosphate synthase
MSISKIVFLNFWPSGMHHYSDATVNVLLKEHQLLYISNYKSETFDNNKIIKLSLNPLNIFNYFSLISIFFSIIKFKPEVIHLNSGFPLLLPLYPFFFFYNSVVTVHDAISHEGETKFKRLFHEFQLFMFSIFFKKIIVHSEKIKEQLPLFINKNKVFIVPHVGYDHLVKAVPDDAKSNNDKFTILFFGRILKYKGLEYLVEAFNYLDSNKYRLIIAGNGNIDFEIKKDNIYIENRFIDDSEISRIFNEADVIAIPYLSASQSGVAHLSFAYSKPVITTNVGSLKDIIIDGKNGIIIEPASVKSLIDAIKRISEVNFYKELIYNIKEQNLNDSKEVLEKLHEAYI